MKFPLSNYWERFGGLVGSPVLLDGVVHPQEAYKLK